jgi:hypothetical protein
VSGTTKVKLTLEKAKKLCGDFDLVQKPDGARCRHVHDDRELCTLGSHFLCELVNWKNGQLRKEKIRGVAISASRLVTVEKCARSYALHYDHGIPSPKDAAWKRMGTAFGVGRARFDVGLDCPEADLQGDLLPVERAKVACALALYKKAISGEIEVGFPYAPGEVSCELEVMFERHGEWFLGFADAVRLNRSAIYEWKYAAGDYPMLGIARQAAVYLAGVPEANEFTLCVMKKQAHRPGKNETIPDFQARVLAAMLKEPREFLSFTTIPRNAIDVEAVIAEMVNSFRRLQTLRDLGMPPSYSSCGDCDYAPVCELNIGATTEQIAIAGKAANP